MPQQQEVKASLGCGTLILIAVIVLLFGGHKDHDTLENKIDQITNTQELHRRSLEDKIDKLMEEVQTLRNEVSTPQLAPERN